MLDRACADMTRPELQQKAASLPLSDFASGWLPAWQSATTTNGTARAAADAATDEDKGWTAELAIPLASLPANMFPPPANGQHWGVNVLVDSRGNGPAPAPAVRRWCLTPTPDPEGPGARWTRIRWDNRKANEVKP
jgi:hypothetical protein